VWAVPIWLSQQITLTRFINPSSKARVRLRDRIWIRVRFVRSTLQMKSECPTDASNLPTLGRDESHDSKNMTLWCERI
jgi:hypothetical protein